MSGLVAYGSSDDEDESQFDIASSNNGSNDNQGSKAEPSKACTDSTASHTESTLNAHGPVMGPVVSADQDVEYESYEEEVNELTDMSERDALRFLTQASHPMTELPPSPPGTPNAHVSTKFRQFHDMKARATHFNDNLANKHAFKNPGMLRMLMDRIGVEERSQYKNSLPATVFDASALPVSGYKEALLESQQTIRTKLDTNKRDQAATGNRAIEFEARGQIL